MALLAWPLMVSAQTSGTFFSGTINYTVPDNNGTYTQAGVATNLISSGLSGTIQSVTATVNLSSTSGGVATVGDYYVSLYETSGANVLEMAVLLNSAGLTSSSQQYYDYGGFNFTFDDSAAANAHFYQTSSQYTGGGNADPQSTQVTGTYASDGEYAAPGNASAFTGVDPAYQLGTFVGNDPNATWTLYVYDGTSGDSAQLVDWSLTITTTPEPATIGLLVAGLAVLSGIYLRQKRCEAPIF